MVDYFTVELQALHASKHLVVDGSCGVESQALETFHCRAYFKKHDGKQVLRSPCKSTLKKEHSPRGGEAGRGVPT